MEKYCFHCDKKLRYIKLDDDYKGWKRRYHAKCYINTKAYRNEILGKMDEINELYKNNIGGKRALLKSCCLL